MQDDLGTCYVAIWLSQAEFGGELCAPPDLSQNPLLANNPSPGWLTSKMSDYYFDVERAIDGFADAIPDAGCLDAACAIEFTRSIDDPNVGRPAREWDHENEVSGYIPAFSPEGDKLNLSRFQNCNHFGGTMIPAQAYPDFGPYYIEFEESFGGFNFGGGGNCQIDLETMSLYWSC